MSGSDIRPKAVCILGMHRSGTSTLSRAINFLGAYLGEEKDIMNPTPTNPEGYWERNDVVILHDRLLNRMKRNYHAVAPLRNNWHRSAEAAPFREELIGLITNNFKGRELWAWKDPRTSLILPLWKDALNELGIGLQCVFAVRNPLDVARSLENREGFPRDKSFGIWFNYNVSALRAAAGVPLVFVSYDRLVEDWKGELKRCADVLGIHWPEDDSELRKNIEAFIRPGLRHSASSMDDLAGSGAPRPVIELYRLLSRVLEGSAAPDESFFAEVERLSIEFSQYSRFYEYDMDQSWELSEKVPLLKSQLSAQMAENERVTQLYLIQVAENERRVNSPDISVRTTSLPQVRAVDRKKISVIITSYNHERYIKECLDSVLIQTGSFDLEIILGDDCSTDKTREIMQQYYEKYPDTIKMLPQEENLGITKNLKRCLDACSGDYIAICEGDDYWTDINKLEKQKDFLEFHKDHSMCFSAFMIYFEETNTFEPHSDPLLIKKDVFTTEDLIEQNYIANFSCCMYRAEVIRKLPQGLFDFFTADWVFNMTCGRFGKIGFIRDWMSVYRKHAHGAWTGKSELEKLTEVSRLIDLYNNFFDYKYDLLFMKRKALFENSIVSLQTNPESEKNDSKALMARNQFLTAYVAEREKVVQALLAQADEREKVVQALLAQADEREKVMQEIYTCRTWRLMQFLHWIRVRVLSFGGHKK